VEHREAEEQNVERFVHLANRIGGVERLQEARVNLGQTQEVGTVKQEQCEGRA
jgi:hypothetical protein